ncbi:hypothetical protein A3A74_04735 [Candidatus Roizmanbacteria bacterium RIFCSPLOWO2_01_FULL_35_13]|uniref:Antitoxin n=1 Tax=Candidatus Roizmanbacteria bacterium RIFCSPLOWO2_01_FULL_35_13 TaxID=1802055 RepID=A0A1F7IF36_9BACT|nr:MAG: hypothetical protein A3A74_04735 [Candidatus Roizmanbacteria bacterium RIFCSPLOWO2_01_FULL_35_13]
MRKIKLFNYITVNSKIRFGKPIIEGTRVPVDLIVGKIAGGMNVDDVMKEYDLTKKKVLATLQYTAKIIFGRKSCRYMNAVIDENLPRF